MRLNRNVDGLNTTASLDVTALQVDLAEAMVKDAQKEKVLPILNPVLEAERSEP